MIFINRQRELTDYILDAISDRLNDLPVAQAALEQGYRECLDQHLDADYPLHLMLTDWPTVVWLRGREPYDGTAIVLAALKTGLLDDESCYHLFAAMAETLLRHQGFEGVVRLAAEDGSAAKMLSPQLFRKLKYRLAALLFSSEEGTAAAQRLIADWPKEIKDALCREVFASHPNPAGPSGEAVLDGITDADLRAETLRLRIQAETAAARTDVARQLQQLRGRRGNLPAFMQVVK